MIQNMGVTNSHAWQVLVIDNLFVRIYFVGSKKELIDKKGVHGCMHERNQEIATPK